MPSLTMPPPRAADAFWLLSASAASWPRRRESPAYQCRAVSTCQEVWPATFSAPGAEQMYPRARAKPRCEHSFQLTARRRGARPRKALVLIFTYCHTGFSTYSACAIFAASARCQQESHAKSHFSIMRAAAEAAAFHFRCTTMQHPPAPRKRFASSPSLYFSSSYDAPSGIRRAEIPPATLRARPAGADSMTRHIAFQPAFDSHLRLRWRINAPLPLLMPPTQTTTPRPAPLLYHGSASVRHDGRRSLWADGPADTRDAMPDALQHIRPRRRAQARRRWANIISRGYGRLAECHTVPALGGGDMPHAHFFLASVGPIFHFGRMLRPALGAELASHASATIDAADDTAARHIFAMAFSAVARPRPRQHAPSAACRFRRAPKISRRCTTPTAISAREKAAIYEHAISCRNTERRRRRACHATQASSCLRLVYLCRTRIDARL